MRSRNKDNMNQSSLNYESDKPTAEPKLFGLSSSFAGALTGILAVLLVNLLYRSIGFISLAMAFLYPGYLTLEKLDSLNIETSALPSFLIYYGVSSLPPAVIGGLIFSNKILSRMTGIILLVIYAISVMFFAFFFHVMAD
jgi:hypothetical protein